MEELLNKINKLSLTNDNLMKRLVILEKNEPKISLSKNMENNSIKKNLRNNNFFYPKANDTLFWCYIIKMYGIDEYEINNTNRFSYEKMKKIELIHSIRNNKNVLKELKIKKSDIESELAYNNTMSIPTFIAIMLINNFNVIYYNDNIYSEYSSEGEKNDLIIITERNDKYGISMENELIDIDKMRSSKLIIENA